MKTLLVFLSSALLLSACQKSFDSPLDNSISSSHETAEKYRVNFNLEDFQISYGDVRKGGNKEMPAKDYLKYLFYGVYDSTGNLVNKIEQGGYSGNMVTGRFADTLGAGRYTMVFAGASDSACVYSQTKLSSLMFGDPNSYYYAQQVFYKKLLLEVKKDTTINNLQLTRITGDFSVNIIDSSFPIKLKSIAVYIDSLYASYNVISDHAQNPYEYNRYIYYADNPPFYSAPVSWKLQSYAVANKSMRIVIRGYDGSHQIIAEKVVNNVYLNANKRTILSGRLFPIPYSTDITVTVDTSYTGDTNVSF